MLRRHRKIVAKLAGFALAGVLAVAGLNAYVLLRAGGATSKIAQEPHAEVAIVPGAFVQPNGYMSGMLADRVIGAVELYKAGKVSKILVSGDHGHIGYDETDTMKAALLRHGIPASAIFTDYAGFDTWSTMERAKQIFGVKSAIVVTQGFHMARALYLGKAAGLQIHGLVADRSGYGKKGKESDVRELLARVKGAEQGVVKPKVMGGPKLPITGDGRISWGPADPKAPLAP